MTDPIIHVLVRDRNKVLYDGPSTGLSSKNSKGVFDILVNHANFISLLNETLYIHQKDKPDILIPMTNALVKVIENNVEVYVGVKR